MSAVRTRQPSNQKNRAGKEKPAKAGEAATAEKKPGRFGGDGRSEDELREDRCLFGGKDRIEIRVEIGNPERLTTACLEYIILGEPGILDRLRTKLDVIVAAEGGLRNERPTMRPGSWVEIGTGTGEESPADRTMPRPDIPDYASKIWEAFVHKCAELKMSPRAALAAAIAWFVYVDVKPADCIDGLLEHGDEGAHMFGALAAQIFELEGLFTSGSPMALRNAGGMVAK